MTDSRKIHRKRKVFYPSLRLMRKRQRINLAKQKAESKTVRNCKDYFS